MTIQIIIFQTNKQRFWEEKENLDEDQFSLLFGFVV